MSATPTPRVDEEIVHLLDSRLNEVEAVPADFARQLERELDFSEKTGRQIWQANERLQRELSAERALADRLAAPLFFNEHEALAGEDLEWTPAHVAAVAAYKEARHDP